VPDAPAAPTPRLAGASLAAAAVLLAATAFYLRFGYSFGAGDHDDLLPELLRRLDPALFSRDPFVIERMVGVSVRGVFVSLLQVLAGAMPVSVAGALLHAAVFGTTALGIYRLAAALLQDLPFAALVAPTVSTALLLLWPLGQNSVAYAYLVPEGVAWALVVHALVWLVRGRLVLPAVLIGLAGWVHAVTGLVVAVALTLTVLAAPAPAGRRLARAALFAGVCALVAAPFALPVALSQSGDAPGALPSAYDLFVRLRLPHHLLPTAFPPASWLRFGALAVAGGASLVLLRRRGRLAGDGVAERFLVVTAVLCAVAAVVVVGFESFAAARMQAFKLTVPAAVLLTVGLCGAAASVVAGAPDNLRRLIALPVRVPLATLAVALLLAGATAVATTAGAGRRGAMWMPRAHAASPDGRLEAWARSETDVDALFIVPPANTSFRVGARRSVLVTWKAHPFRAEPMRHWLRTLQLVAPAPWMAGDPGGWSYLGRTEDAYCANDAAAWRRIAGETGADYAVVEAGCGTPAAPAAFRAGPMSVHALLAP